MAIRIFKDLRTLGLTLMPVKGRISNILNILPLADRSQATVYAWQVGFLQRQ